MEENANRLSLLSRKTNRLLKLKTLHIKTDKILMILDRINDQIFFATMKHIKLTY